jgi:hypothetical protein
MTEKITETHKRTKSQAAKAVQNGLAVGAKELKSEVQAIVKRKRGQPTKFTPEKWERILQCVASYGDLIEVCQEPDMPAVTTVGDWIRRDAELMEDMRKAWQVFSMIGYSVNNNVLRGGVLSTGDKARDIEVAANNRWMMGKTNRRDFGDKTVIQVETAEPWVLEGYLLPGGEPKVIDVKPDDTQTPD